MGSAALLAGATIAVGGSGVAQASGPATATTTATTTAATAKTPAPAVAAAPAAPSIPTQVQDGAASRVGLLPANQPLRLTLGLATPRPQDETRFLAALQTKGSPQFHHYLTPAQYTARAVFW